LFSPDQTHAADFGRAVHGLLAEVEWGGAATVAQCATKWRLRDLMPGASEEALECMEAVELVDIWRKRPFAEVWRERRF